MRIRRFAAAIALGAAAIALSACATALDTRVTRYQAMPAPQGQTFAVVPVGPMAANGGLEFQRYAAIVAQQLAVRGYTPAASPASANMIVQLGYGIDQGQVRVQSDPFGPYGYGYRGSFGRSSFFYPRFGCWGSPFYYGWDDPFWMGGGIDSYVEYHSEVDLHIRAAGHQPAPVRRPRPGALGDQPARRCPAEPDRGPLHRLPRPQRRDGEDHHPDETGRPPLSVGDDA